MFSFNRGVKFKNFFYFYPHESFFIDKNWLEKYSTLIVCVTPTQKRWKVVPIRVHFITNAECVEENLGKNTKSIQTR